MSDLKRHIGQKVALVTAVFCALLALPAFGLFIWLWIERGLGDTWVPSALSSVDEPTAAIAAARGFEA